MMEERTTSAAGESTAVANTRLAAEVETAASQAFKKAPKVPEHLQFAITQTLKTLALEVDQRTTIINVLNCQDGRGELFGILREVVKKTLTTHGSEDDPTQRERAAQLCRAEAAEHGASAHLAGNGYTKETDVLRAEALLTHLLKQQGLQEILNCIVRDLSAAAK